MTRTVKKQIVVDRVPPQAIELEEAILGAMMLENHRISDITTIIKSPDVFYKDEHQQVFRAIIQLDNEGKKVDILTVTEQLRKNQTLESIGGPYQVAKLTQNVVSGLNSEYHAAVVWDKFLGREMIRVGNEMIQGAFDPSVDVSHLLNNSESSLLSLHLSETKSSGINDVGSKAAREIYSAQKTKTIGIPTGISSIDKFTGLVQENFMVIAGRPGMGKTALALSIIRHIAGSGVPVAFFSLEMSDTELFKRMMSAECEINLQRLMRGDMDPAEWDCFNGVLPKLLALPISIIDCPAMEINELRARARRLKLKNNIGLIVIDYLQLMHGPGRTREEEISNISRKCKSLAKELNIPVIALAQLSRECEKRVNNRPILSDLRESGSIEQDADVVLFTYRPWYYNNAEDPETAEIIIAKNRNGSTGTGDPVRFIGKYTKFSNREQSENTSKPF